MQKKKKNRQKEIKKKNTSEMTKNVFIYRITSTSIHIYITVVVRSSYEISYHEVFS